MKAELMNPSARSGPKHVKLTFETEAEYQAALKLRRGLTKASIAEDFDEDKGSDLVRNANAIGMLVGTVLDREEARNVRSFDVSAPRRNRRAAPPAHRW